MSSFKRKVPTAQAARGTQLSPSSASTTLISTGIPSLDDILGGGLPLSCSLLITGSDYHSSYNELVQRYFVSQGLDKNQNVILIHHDAGSFAKECMWTSAANASRDVKDDDTDNNTKIKIAWRYEEMKQFRTTVTAQSSEEFCSIFDLTCRIPESQLDRALKSKQLRVVDVPSFSGLRTTLDIVEEVERLLAEDKTLTPLRICIPAFGSLDWGDITSTDVTIFLYRLQVLLRRHPHACASITLVPHVGLDSWGGSGWIQKLGWLSDAFIKLSAFSSNPALSALSPSHHGLLEIHALPSPHTLISPSDKHSVLRGLSSAAMSAGGSGENNLAFKCTRKRLIFETLHLDVEGGVGERRTTPSSTQDDPHVRPLPKAAFASVDVSIEQPTTDTSENHDTPRADLLSAPPPDEELSHKVKKPKKRVAFHSDRPDLRRGLGIHATLCDKVKRTECSELINGPGILLRDKTRGERAPPPTTSCISSCAPSAVETKEVIFRGKMEDQSTLRRRPSHPDFLQASTGANPAVGNRRVNLDKPLPPMPPQEGLFRRSWIDLDTEEHNGPLDYDDRYLRDHAASLLAPPSSMNNGMTWRARASTHSSSAPIDDHWSHFSSETRPGLHSTNSESTVSLNSPASPYFSPGQSPLVRSASEGEPSFEAGRSRSLSRSTSKSLLSASPSFPDPYPFRPPHHMVPSPPGLSSADSSSASTRSSAYTNSGSALASGDFGHVHVASGDDEASVGVGITSDAVVQLLANDALSSSSTQGMHSRAPIDRSRWSQGSVRSRSSSIGNSNPSHSHDLYASKLHEKPSFDMDWHTVDERDEVGISEEDTDLDDDEYEDEDDHDRTSAAVIADEGRGLIVQGDSVTLSQLSVEPGTTHLLIGSSNNSNAMPAFLTTNIPPISHSLLALDISANFLGALPPVLAYCDNLEELNIASNPLRVLPVFLADLVNLRVLIADATGISTLPDTLVDLDKLHTISVRRNKMHALPSWLCLLPALQTLCVDGNPFQGPWKALVEPLLAKMPMTPMYPPSTPMFPLPSASLNGQSEGETDGTDIDDDSAPPSAASHTQFLPPEEEDYTITPVNAPLLRSEPVPSHAMPPDTSTAGAKPLVRTRTTPNRSFYEQSRVKSTGNMPKGAHLQSPPDTLQPEDSGYFGDRELRKMKSAGDLRRGKSAPQVEPSRPPLTQYAASSSNLLVPQNSPSRPQAKRFASLGPATALGSPSRPPLTGSLWDNISEDEEVRHDQEPMHFVPHSTSSPRRVEDDVDLKATVRMRHGKDKASRWGFLKKMSMGKIRVDPPVRVPTRPGGTPPSQRTARSPQIDVRFSTTGMLDVATPISPPQSPPQLQARSKPEMLAMPPDLPSSNLLAPPSPMPRASKRRSFLPFDTPISLNIPEASTFVPGVTATNDEDIEARVRTPSPVFDADKLRRREEERARDAYMRALRSVMAYLKDMNDLAVSSQPPGGSPGLEEPTTRSRRPTLVDGGREVSLALSGTTAVSSEVSQLRSRESIAGIRSGGSLQTLSVATTDSNGSAEERVYKDDKGKRSMVVREIVTTERTYVKGLQELMDIYIKPGCAPVNLISGVGSKDTIVPPSERKVVFNGVDALFSFHKDSFLPALEMAAAPLMKPTQDKSFDTDGQISANVAKAVGNIFVKHAAFMKMYSSYINNFDNAMQRVKHWTSDRQPVSGSSSPGSSMSPSSSTAQLVGFGLTMSAVSAPGVMDNNVGPAGVANLSSSQRKRIRQYLKRCRLNPRHSQLNLDGYLLLPVQRIPRYRLLLEELLRSTPPSYEMVEDPLDRALAEISLLANNMNEGKRETEGRRKLVQWQSRIRGKFPSPLVQPHRRLIMDGNLLLTRVVRKAVVTFEAINGQGDASSVQVDCLAPELTPRPLVGILCNDLLVLCRDPSEGQDPGSYVDLWAVLRMQTLPQPASIVHGNALRLVDNKAILYFEAPSSSDALNWFRAINLHIPASKT